jgi:hypothetical protein
MNRKRPWIIVGTAAIAIAGFGTAAAAASDDDSGVRDPHLTPVVQQFDSTPMHSGAVAHSANSAQTANSVSTADTANTADSPNPVKAPVADSAGSGNSAD